MPERGAEPLCDRLRALDVRSAEVENAEHDGLAGEIGEHAEIEPRLGGLDRQLRGDGVRERREKRVAARLVRDERGIPEADVHGRRRLEPFERAIDRAYGIAPRRVDARLEPRLVELNDVRTRG